MSIEQPPVQPTDPAAYAEQLIAENAATAEAAAAIQGDQVQQGRLDAWYGAKGTRYDQYGNVLDPSSTEASFGVDKGTVESVEAYRAQRPGDPRETAVVHEAAASSTTEQPHGRHAKTEKVGRHAKTETEDREVGAGDAGDSLSVTSPTSAEQIDSVNGAANESDTAAQEAKTAFDSAVNAKLDEYRKSPDYRAPVDPKEAKDFYKKLAKKLGEAYQAGDSVAAEAVSILLSRQIEQSAVQVSKAENGEIQLSTPAITGTKERLIRKKWETVAKIVKEVQEQSSAKSDVPKPPVAPVAPAPDVPAKPEGTEQGDDAEELAKAEAAREAVIAAAKKPEVPKPPAAPAVAEEPKAKGGEGVKTGDDAEKKAREAAIAAALQVGVDVGQGGTTEDQGGESKAGNGGAGGENGQQRPPVFVRAEEDPLAIISSIHNLDEFFARVSELPFHERVEAMDRRLRYRAEGGVSYDRSDMICVQAMIAEIDAFNKAEKNKPADEQRFAPYPNQLRFAWNSINSRLVMNNYPDGTSGYTFLDGELYDSVELLGRIYEIHLGEGTPEEKAAQEAALRQEYYDSGQRLARSFAELYKKMAPAHPNDRDPRGPVAPEAAGVVRQDTSRTATPSRTQTPNGPGVKPRRISKFFGRFRKSN